MALGGPIVGTTRSDFHEIWTNADFPTVDERREGYLYYVFAYAVDPVTSAGFAPGDNIIWHAGPSGVYNWRVIGRSSSESAYAPDKEFTQADIFSGDMLLNAGRAGVLHILDEQGFVILPDSSRYTPAATIVRLTSYVPITGTWTMRFVQPLPPLAFEMLRIGVEVTDLQHTVTAADLGLFLEMYNSLDNEVLVTDSEGVPTGLYVTILRKGSGGTRIQAAPGTYLAGRGTGENGLLEGYVDIMEQMDVVMLRKMSATVWLVFGAVEQVQQALSSSSSSSVYEPSSSSG